MLKMSKTIKLVVEHNESLQSVAKRYSFDHMMLSRKVKLYKENPEAFERISTYNMRQVFTGEKETELSTYIMLLKYDNVITLKKK